MSYVFDACAMIAFLRGESGAEVVADLLVSNTACYAHTVNLCEVYYDFIRMKDESTARAALKDLRKVGIRTRRDIGDEFVRRVGRFKGKVRRISLADCFAVELARELDAEVVTSDHHEFDPLVTQKLCRVVFIR